MKDKLLIERNILFILLLSITLGFFFPYFFLWANNFLHSFLALIAFCVGLTLSQSNFRNVWQNKKFILPVLSFKYLIIPLITFSICNLFQLPLTYTIGLVVITCCPAANTGNMMCYLSRGNTAMIVITTITGALLAPVITPGIIYFLLHKVVSINYLEIIRLISTSITLPMISGLFLKYLFPKQIGQSEKYIPSIGILTVSLIIAAVIAKNANELLNINNSLPLICCILITLFLFLGFIISKLMKCEIRNSIAMSFEIGTFDGVLGILLALQIAGNAASLPVILFAVINLIIGSLATKIFTSKNFLEYEK